KTSLLGLCGMMLVGLSACFAGSADMLQENESQVMEFRRQIDQLKLQVKTKDEETKRLMQELEKDKKVEAQILGLEERLRAMDDVVVQAVSTAQAAYDHPVRLSEQDLTNSLRSVRVQFTTHWLQRLLTGPVQSVPLFDGPTLAKVVPAMAAAMGKAGTRERTVFYVAKRRGPDRRDVTTGSLFVKDMLLTIVLGNYQNRGDVIPGLPPYDKTRPYAA